jgi:rhodanese-related sulfurtransferase/biotin operon repressor
MGNFKHDLFEQFARVAKAMGNANRLEILEFLAQGEHSVDALSKVTGLSVANTSQHLQLLRQSGLVSSEKQGQKVIYRLSGDDVTQLFGRLRNVAERHLGEVHRLVNDYLVTRDGLEPIPAQELLERARADLVTVLDVRPHDEFNHGHVPGAISVPLDELENHLNQLDPDQQIVAYCRGPHCILAFDAVARLRDKGFDARRLEGGFPEWKLEGLPVEN